MSSISIIAAYSMPTRSIGLKGKLPWNYPEDLAFLKETLSDKPCVIIAGKNTSDVLQSLKWPFPAHYLCVSTSRAIRDRGELSVRHAIDKAKRFWPNLPIYILGGACVYEEGLQYADQLLITEIDKVYKGDTYFPEVDYSHWKLIDRYRGEDSTLTFKEYVKVK